MNIFNRKRTFFLTIMALIFIVFLFTSNITRVTPAPADVTRFISFGDNPHVPENDVENNLNMLLESINEHDSALIIHVGDTLGGREPCTDSMIDLQRNIMNRLDAPVLYTPGDNEWRDCYQEKKGDVYDNQERLAYIRKTYFSDNKTLGKNSINVENQYLDGYPENARLMIDNVAFVTAHLVGSNNNLDATNERNTIEYLARDTANINWITESFKKYEKANAIVVAIHADMYSEGSLLSFEYKKFAMALYNLSNQFEKPVLILYGDSHKFKEFQPMPKKYPYIYAIENYGNPDLKALLIEIDIKKDKPFTIIKVIKGESLKTWFLRNLFRTVNYLTRNLKKIASYLE